jgi:hypothetical protein
MPAIELRFHKTGTPHIWNALTPITQDAAYEYNAYNIAINFFLHNDPLTSGVDEIRWNWKDSFQGHYVSRHNANSSLIATDMDQKFRVHHSNTILNVAEYLLFRAPTCTAWEVKDMIASITGGRVQVELWRAKKALGKHYIQMGDGIFRKKE